MMISGIVDFAFKLFFPKAPAWIATLLSTAVPAVIDLVEAIDEAQDKHGKDKFDFVIQEVRKMLDEGLDSIPEWDTYPEEGRDRILGGLVELAVFVHKVADDDTPKAARRKLRRVLKSIG